MSSSHFGLSLADPNADFCIWPPKRRPNATKSAERRTARHRQFSFSRQNENCCGEMKDHGITNRLCVMLFVGLTLIGPVFAQDSGPNSSDGSVVEFATFARPRRMIFFFEVTEDTITEYNQFVLYNSIMTTAGSANPDVIVLESPDTVVPPTLEGKHDLARIIDADAWLYVSIAGSMESLRAEIETFDILRQTYHGAHTIQPTVRTDARTLSRGFWDPIAETLRSSYGRVVDTVEVRIAGRPGTRVTGLAETAIELDDTEIAIPLPNPATYTYRAELAGHYPIEDTFYLGFDSVTIELDHVPGARWAVDAYGNNFQFPGMNFSWYFVPATAFVRAGFTTFAFGVYLVEGLSGNAPLISGNPLTNFSAHAGLYVTEPGRDLRLYGGAGAFVRLLHDFPSDGESVFGPEPTAPYGFAPFIGVEYSPWLSFRFYVEYAPLLYRTADPDEFRARSFPLHLFPDGRIPGYLFFDSFALDYRTLALGVRFMW